MTGIIGILKYMAFERQLIRLLCVNRTIHIYTSRYFKSTQTYGFPVALCVCPDLGIAWLVPSEKKLSDKRYRNNRGDILRSIAKFGIINCRSTEELTVILRGLEANRTEYADDCDEWQYVCE